jgi:lipoate-protein ligase A
MLKLDQNAALTHLEYCRRYRKTDTFYGIWTESLIHYGEDVGYDKDKALGMRKVDLHRRGGAFVTQPGDIAYAHVTFERDSFNQKLSKFLIKKLAEKGIIAEYSGNDLLINGRKVMGHMMKYWGGSQYFYGGHISFSVDLEQIESVCTKPMEKIPAGLNEFGVTREEVEEWLHEFWFRFK